MRGLPIGSSADCVAWQRSYRPVDCFTVEGTNQGANMPRVVHFEFHSNQPEGTTDFFRRVFDWKIDKWDNLSADYWMLDTGPADQPGIGGGLMKSRDGQPRTVCTIDVPDVDAYAKKVTAAGGQIVVPKM